MPKIHMSTIVRKSPSFVYAILKDIESYPSFMKDAKEIKIIKKIKKNMVITKWHADIEGTPVEWIEEDKFNETDKNVELRMIEGDFEKYKGKWELKPAKNGTRLSFEAQLEWGVPNFEKYIGHILEEKACRSIRSMLWLIRKKAHGSR